MHSYFIQDMYFIIIPDDGFGIVAETLDFDLLIHFSVKTNLIKGWDNE